MRVKVKTNDFDFVYVCIFVGAPSKVPRTETCLESSVPTTVKGKKFPRRMAQEDACRKPQREELSDIPMLCSQPSSSRFTVTEKEKRQSEIGC